MFRMAEQEGVSDWNVPVDSLPHWLSNATPYLNDAIKEASTN